MNFDPAKHSILLGYLEEVERVMLESGCSHDEAAGVVGDLTFQIEKMMDEIDGEITEADQIAILRSLDDPSAYAQDDDSRPSAERKKRSFEEEPPLSEPEVNQTTSSRRSRSMVRGCIVSIVIALILVIISVLIVSLFQSHNRIVAADETVDSSFAQVETALQRRFDLIPNLVATVKGFAEQEKEIFLEIARLRTQWMEAGDREEKVEAADRLDEGVSRVVRLVESYPALRSSEQFNQLLYQLEGTENRIAVERNRYNNAIRNYNTRVREFPGNVFGFETRNGYFEAEEKATTAPEVSF